MFHKIKSFLKKNYPLFIKFSLSYKRFFMSRKKWKELFNIETMWFVAVAARGADICTPFLPVIRKFPFSHFFIKWYLLHAVKKQKHKCLVFCFPHELFAFFEKRIIPLLEKPFVFISMESDKPASETLKTVLLLPKLGHVFCIHNDLHPHKKVTGFPVGINFHERMCRTEVFGTKRIISAQEQELQLLEIKESHLEGAKYNKIYCSFHKSITHPRRVELYNIFKDNPLCYFKTLYPRELFWADARKYQFMLCPRGAGFEAMRTWEALVLEIIPIVESSPLDYLFEGLPVVILQSSDEIIEENLNKWKRELLPRFHSDAMKRITNTYWINKVREKQQEIECM